MLCLRCYKHCLGYSSSVWFELDIMDLQVGGVQGALLKTEATSILKHVIANGTVAASEDQTSYHTITYLGTNFPATRFNALCGFGLFIMKDGVCSSLVNFALLASSYGMDEWQARPLRQGETLPLRALDLFLSTYVTQQRILHLTTEQCFVVYRALLSRVLLYVKGVNMETGFQPSSVVLQFQLWDQFTKVRFIRVPRPRKFAKLVTIPSQGRLYGSPC